MKTAKTKPVSVLITSVDPAKVNARINAVRVSLECSWTNPRTVLSKSIVSPASISSANQAKNSNAETAAMNPTPTTEPEKRFGQRSADVFELWDIRYWVQFTLKSNWFRSSKFV